MADLLSLCKEGANTSQWLRRCKEIALRTSTEVRPLFSTRSCSRTSRQKDFNDSSDRPCLGFPPAGQLWCDSAVSLKTSKRSRAKGPFPPFRARTRDNEQLLYSRFARIAKFVTIRSNFGHLKIKSRYLLSFFREVTKVTEFYL